MRDNLMFINHHNIVELHKEIIQNLFIMERLFPTGLKR